MKDSLGYVDKNKEFLQLKLKSREQQARDSM